MRAVLTAGALALLGATTAGAAEPPPPAAAAAPNVDGDWSGALQVGGQTVRVVFRLQGQTATLDSPDQNVSGLQAGPVLVVGRNVRVPVPVASAVFEGVLSPDGGTLVGQWRQAGVTAPLTLKKGTVAAPALDRPQTPKGPFPYREVRADWPNPAAPGATLAGTLTLPEGPGPFPAVLLITGSGQQDRDETIFGHKPFLVLADALTRKGVAVLRVDDRGIGGSQGAAVLTATTADFAEDAKASLAWLRARPEIDAKRVGVLGHSEGGVIAARLAASDPAIGFVVLMAGPALPGDDILVEQSRALNKAAGVPAAQVEASAALQRRLMDALTGPGDTAALRAAALKIMTDAGAPPAVAEQQLGPLTSPWYQWYLRHDPQTDLKRIKVPVLALFGGKDAQVPPDSNLAPMKAALAGDKAAVVEVVPGVNHLFQTAGTGSLDEYAKITETLAPAALDRMVGWIVQTTGAAR